MNVAVMRFEKLFVENRLGAAIVGSDATVLVGLEKLVNDTHADEVIVVADTYEHNDRMDSDERVARVAAENKLVAMLKRDSDEPFTPEDRQAPPRHLQARALAKGGPETSKSVRHLLIGRARGCCRHR